MIPVLEAHLAASPNRFRGIRHSTTWDESGTVRSDAGPGLLADSAFRRGFACLQRYALSFDAWLYHPQLPELVDLARAFPAVTIFSITWAGRWVSDLIRENAARFSAYGARASRLYQLVLTWQ